MDQAQIEGAQLIAFVASLGGLLIIETVAPLLPNPHRLQHGRRNMAMTAINSALNFGLRGMLLFAAGWSEYRGIGIFSDSKLSPVAIAVLGVFLLDFSNYVLHRMKHGVPFLWRFHRVHHSDPHLDVTSGARFHPGETLFSILFQSVVVILLGIPFWALLLYFLILTVMIQFGHANVKWPARFDRLMRLVLVSPYMHRTHHSRVQSETDTNYGDIFPYWDKLFGTYHDRGNYDDLRTGLDGFDSRQTVLRLLLMPFDK